MADLPARPDTRDQDASDLRTALDRLVPLVAFAAGHLAATDPDAAEQLVAAAYEAEQVLARTAPESSGAN